ncbi:DegT/DnrJ/EryC1/StrS family aminotransferase (plasmid) [Bernardetia sp. Wsw4-3y2]|uniref:DegT/DnrJ/EryC1/StrS family aminotransferase n=1 Tax=Bernardetia sp. Wsw4-3y2 TaxID=3127471 RepID=UPI0030CD50BF
MINVTKTYLPPLEEYQNYLKKIWDSAWLTNRGELVKELEQKLTSFLGVPNLLFVNNGTIALQIAIKALDLKGEIITTPFSYVATTSSIVWEGCEPIFVDIEKNTLCIDADLIENAITEKTTGILATHVYGIPCDVEKIEKIAQKHNLKVIYDAAHCFGVKYKGQSLLNYGDISTLSFHATKLFHTGEGGGIVANNKEVFDKLFYMHNFGHNGPEDFFGVGINGKSSELHAAMGLSILPYIQQIVAKRKEISLLYDELLLKNTSLRCPKLPKQIEYNYPYYPILFDSEEKLLDVQKRLNDNNIFPRRYFYPSLNTLKYTKSFSCPVSENISTRVLCLPLYYDLDLSDVEKIGKLIIL